MQTPAPLNIYHLVKKVEQATIGLSQVAKDESCELGELVRVWAILPVDDQEGMTYLEAASQCILEVSALIDKTDSGLPQNQRTAKKLRLMGKLLELKAEQLV